MLKKYLLLGIITIAFSTVAVNAAPVFTSDLGGLQYNSTNQSFSGASDSRAVNNAVEKYTTKKGADVNVNSNININVDTDDYTVPASSNTKYSFGRGSVDTTSSYDDIPSSGVNASKTIYTDDLGRLHFFGKKNIIKE